MQISISNSIRGFLYGGGVTPPSGTFLLDTYPGATGAYSLRKLKSTYAGSAIRVRRSSNNAETDIGFVNNELDTTSLLNFINGENYLTYSQDFTQAASWTKTAVTVTAAAGTAPDGTNTAQKCVPSAAVTTKAVYQTIPSVSTRDYVFSMYAKAAEYNYMQLLAIRDSTNRYSIVVDLTTGAITQTNTVGTPNFINSSVTSVGNGWYRIVITLNINLGTNYFVFSPSPVSNPTLNASLDLQSAGNGTSGVLFWGAQLNYASLKSYTVTTTAAVIPTSTNGFVTKVYSQEGYSDLTQTTAANQPTIVSAGVVQTVNNKPCLVFDGTTSSMGSGAAFAGSNLSTFDVFKINDTLFSVHFGGFSDYLIYGNSASTQAADSITLLSRYKNNVLKSTSNATQVATVFGNNTPSLASSYYGAVNFAGMGFFNQDALRPIGSWQESIFYKSNQLANNTPINTNISTYYDIFIGTGLLDTYPGAVAAYSLRNLTNTYDGPLVRVKRSSDNAQLDIFGSALGQLNTTSLLSFVGSGDGFVTIWYDQSGNGNHVFSSNPKIVSAGAFLGYIVFDGTTNQFLCNTGNNSWNGSQNALFTSVTAPDIATPNGVFGTGSNINIAETASWGMIYQTVGPTFINWRFGTGQTGNDETYTRPSSTSFCIVNTHKNGTTENAYLNNNLVKTVSGKLATLAGNSSTNILLSFGNGAFWKGFQKEVILYNSNQTANISGINTNINSYYNIY